MNTPSPASIGLGMALMVNPRLCLGAALTTLGRTAATSVVTTVASTAKRVRMSAPFEALWCGASAGLPAPYQAAAMNAPENTAPEAKLRSRLCAGGLFYPRRGLRPGSAGPGVLADRALLPRVGARAVGFAVRAPAGRATRGTRGRGPRPDATSAQRP